MVQPLGLTRSLGILIYEMLVGLPPFYSRNKKEMYGNLLHKATAAAR
jgi:serine/threonine protein kinase